eukprot:TRINITY_DN7447_c0_g2_i1.p1 TRINITY_DN7447_c0_g2~~TRINITY_DN7447_c0_g2_i1.p1  ORF type:complete len:147 (-),score=2.63 TRINITY_DN7447_c0_g2_i1:132-572(-)
MLLAPGGSFIRVPLPAGGLDEGRLALFQRVTAVPANPEASAGAVSDGWMDARLASWSRLPLKDGPCVDGRHAVEVKGGSEGCPFVLGCRTPSLPYPTAADCISGTAQLFAAARRISLRASCNVVATGPSSRAKATGGAGPCGIFAL